MIARILDCTPDEYHRLPGFSPTLAKVIISQSPAHAHDVQQRRAEAEVEAGADDELTEQQIALRERGSVLHKLMLGAGKAIAVLPYDKYTTKVARTARDDARRAGRIPVKRKKMDAYEHAAEQLTAKLNSAGHELYGKSELAIAWTEETPWGDLECRGMLDHVVAWGINREAADEGPPGAIIYDIKIVDDASPTVCERAAERMLHSIQAAAYTRGLAALHPQLGGRIEFRFLFCEARRPFGIWAPRTDGAFRELGNRRWLRAVNAQARGIATGEWPCYGDRVDITPPNWALREEGIEFDG